MIAEAVRAGPPHGGYEMARASITGCEVSGGAALADRWLHVAGDNQSDLATLHGRTRVFRDRALLRRAIELVRDPTRPTSVRTALIDVLVSYYAPGRSLSRRALAADNDPAMCSLGSLTHYRSEESANPILPEDHPLILEALESVAKGEGNDAVRRVAACAWHPLKRMSERTVP